MRTLATLLATAAAGLALVPAAHADLVVDGRGFGHGVGMSQYGAYGYALREGRDFRWILGHYYTGTTVGSAPSSSLRVLLKRTLSPKVCGATAVRDAAGRRVRLSSRRAYRIRPRGTGGLRVLDTATGRTRARLRAPARITGGQSVCLRGTAENGLNGGRYRGSLVVSRDATRLLVVNRLSLERYLYGVVPAEMPTSWSTEAVKAQAVVARSYALRGRRPAAPFDVYADVRSQVYRGLDAETPEGNAAVLATRGRVVRYGSTVAQTLFFSTSGGRTASNEEAFGTTPVAYLRSVADPHDDLSPVHTWTERFTPARAASLLRAVTEGELRDIQVAARGASGRAATVTVTGSEGTRDVPAATIRSLLGLRSTWFFLDFAAGG